MADTRVKDLNEASVPGSDYYLLTDSAADGVKKVKTTNVIAKADIGLGNVDNTSDVNKPVSTATQGALDLKADLASPVFTGTPTAPTASVGTDTTQLATTAFVLANASGSFTQAGTGAVARTMQDKARDIVSVKDFGAVGDGTTDDTTAINNAIAAAANKAVFFPSGTYKVTSAIDITVPVVIFGQGRGATTVTTDHATADLLTVNAADVSIFDLTLSTSVTKTAGALVNFNGQYNSAIQRFKCSGEWFVGVKIGGAGVWNIRVIDGQLANTGNTSAIGVQIGGSANSVDIVLRDLWILGASSASQITAGVAVYNVGDATLDHVSTIWAGSGLQVVPGNLQTVQALAVTNCFFDSGSGWGIYCTPQHTAGSVSLLKVSNIWVATNTAGGIALSGTGSSTIKQCDILGCTIANNPSHGVLIDGAFATNTRVIGGNISQNTTGVYCNTNATKFCIQGVKIGASGEFTANTTGITLAGGNDDFVISDNEITGNTTQINLASYSGTRGRIIDNVGYNSVGTATFTPPASGVTYQAGPSPETIYFGGGTVSNFQVNGVAIYYSGGTVTNVAQLGPNETYTMTYSAAPTVSVRTIH